MRLEPEHFKFTPPMILAGVDALVEFHHEGAERLVKEIVRAVLRQRRESGEDYRF